MDDREPTVRSRELGMGLRRAMEDGQRHASGIARALDWSPSRVSRILSGKRGGSTIDVAAFLAVCGVGGRERDRLMELSQDLRPNWTIHHTPPLPRQSTTLANHELHAGEIAAYHPGAIPDLLQTRSYASAVLTANPTVPNWDIPRRVDALVARQQVLNSDEAPNCDFIIHESALHIPVGNAAVVMSDQLHSLLRSSVRPTIRIQVVPRSFGAHPGMTGPFTVLNVREFKRIVAVETDTASHFIETRAEVEAYRTLLRTLRGAALDDLRSRELIAKVAVKYSSSSLNRNAAQAPRGDEGAGLVEDPPR